MKQPDDQRIISFLDDLKLLSGYNSDVIEQVRAMFFALYPTMSERMMYGGIMFSLEKDVSGIFSYKKHVSLEFSDGNLLNDPDNILQGSGKLRRHLKLKSIDDIKKKNVQFFVGQLSQL